MKKVDRLTSEFEDQIFEVKKKKLNANIYHN